MRSLAAGPQARHTRIRSFRATPETGRVLAASRGGVRIRRTITYRPLRTTGCIGSDDNLVTVWCPVSRRSRRRRSCPSFCRGGASRYCGISSLNFCGPVCSWALFMRESIRAPPLPPVLVWAFYQNGVSRGAAPRTVCPGRRRIPNDRHDSRFLAGCTMARGIFHGGARLRRRQRGYKRCRPFVRGAPAPRRRGVISCARIPRARLGDRALPVRSCLPSRAGVAVLLRPAATSGPAMGRAGSRLLQPFFCGGGLPRVPRSAIHATALPPCPLSQASRCDSIRDVRHRYCCQPLVYVSVGWLALL